MYGGYGDHMAGAAWLWGLGWLLLIIVGVVLAVWVVTSIVRGDRHGSTGSMGSSVPPAPGPGTPLRPEPLDILRERFARGEITQEEFETAKRVLGYGP